MKKFILIPDSFKGTLSCIEVCNIIEGEIKNKYPDARVLKIPVADGGEGSVDAFLAALGGQKVFLNVSGPYFERLNSFYGLIDDGKTAIIEMAACAGLPLVGDNKNPSTTTTFGVGELILDAINQGAGKIILGLGGSCTNDAGAGLLSALGIRFINEDNKIFVPVGQTLDKIAKIDLSNLDSRLKRIEFVTICDINNPLYGPDGAAYVFGPQKGANPKMVKMLDRNLQHFAKISAQFFGFNQWNFEGAGAAGGMGFGMKYFLNSKIQMGIETMLDVISFDQIIKDTDYIITGEGRLDSQSLRGKVVIGVARRAKKYKAKVIAVVGTLDIDEAEVYNEGVDMVVITNSLNLPFEELKLRAEDDLRTAVFKFIESL